MFSCSPRGPLSRIWRREPSSASCSGTHSEMLMHHFLEPRKCQQPFRVLHRIQNTLLDPSVLMRGNAFMICKSSAIEVALLRYSIVALYNFFTYSLVSAGNFSCHHDQLCQKSVSEVISGKVDETSTRFTTHSRLSISFSRNTITEIQRLPRKVIVTISRVK